MTAQYLLLLPVLSVLISLACLCLFIPQRIKGIGVVASGFVLSGVLSVAYIAINYFTGEGLNDAVVMHALYGFQQLQLQQFKMLIVMVLTAILLVTLLACQFVRLAKKKSTEGFSKSLLASGISYLLVGFSVFAHPAVLETSELYTKYRAALSSEKSREFHHFLSEQEIRHKPQQQSKNIVYIYAESLERSFFDENAFPGLLKGLRSLEKQALSFSNVHQVQLTQSFLWF